MPDLKFPRRALLPVLQATILNLPAGAEVLRSFFHGQQEEHLPLHMGRDPAPPLLETLNRPEGNSQELGHFFLRLPEPPTEQRKFLGVHGHPPEKIFITGDFFLDSLYHTVLLKETLFFNQRSGCQKLFKN
jgi:hypothetical protein